MSTDDLIQSEPDADGYALIGACFDVYNKMGNGDLDRGEIHELKPLIFANSR
jgi:hypothetical protein